MGLITRDQILQAPDLKTADIEVPEWGGTVRLQSLNGSRREKWEAALVAPDSDKVRATLAAMSIIDEDGDLMFSVEDVEVLSTKSFSALNKIYQEALKLNAIASPEETEKN